MPVPTPSLRRTLAALASAATLAGFVGLATSSPAEGAFPGANGLIAYAEYDRDADDQGVGVMQPDGSGATILAASSVDENSPNWSPDGSKLVYASGNGASSEIWVMNADGSGQTQLTENDQQDYQPAWSADGTQIAFVRQMPSSFYDIWVMDADGTGEYNLTNTSDGGVSAFAPAWSPDGSRIAFDTRTSAEDDWDIYTVAPDGSGREQLTADDGLDASSPDWSPDGSRIAYALSDGEDPADLWVMDADGSDQELLYGTGDSEASPAWSPDGTKVAFAHYGGETSRIGIIDADGSNPVLVTPANVDRSNPNWQPIAVGPTTTTTASSVVPTAPHTSVAPLTPVARAVAQSPRFTG